MSRQTLVCRFVILVLSIIIASLLSSSVYAGVVINEFLPNPEDENEEFIELYNAGELSEDISGWILDDKSDVGSPYVIPSGIFLSSHEFLIFVKGTTKIGLNNDGDIVQLFSKSGDLIDAYNYSSTKKGVSFGRSQDGAGEFLSCVSVTKGSQNNCPLPTSTPTNTPTNSPTSTNTPTSTPTHTPTKTPTPSPTVTPISTPKPTNTLTPKPTEKEAQFTATKETDEGSGGINTSQNILGESDTASESSSAAMGGNASKKVFIITFLFIGMGCAGSSLAFVLRKQFFPDM